MEKKGQMERDLDFIKRKVSMHDTLLQNHVMAMEKLITIMDAIAFDLSVIRQTMEERM